MMGRSFGTDDAGLEEVKLSAAIHLAFDEFELGDLAFGLGSSPIESIS
ncbi:hypothetical protein FBZ90_12923 [Nitrospirillum pindoramense]|uniref:Uncharacterized protein n=1 Tax=Nitrospirillum amazonense TaxID=28077 RepID=A0A560GIR8_9PROT|nr:hypothetical protein FBZ90_12923 [Nitrospirillum amazonense]